jgi:hypothetical protein
MIKELPGVDFKPHDDLILDLLLFKEMIGVSLSVDEKRVMENTKAHILGN